MKKTIILAIALTLGLSMNAQNKIGGKLAYGSEIKSLGIGAKGIFPLSDMLSISGELIYFFGDSNKTSLGVISTATRTSNISLNGDLHYNFDANLPFNSYALGGLNASIYSNKTAISGIETLSNTNISETIIGLNLGVGGSYPMSDNLEIVSELKYVLGDLDQVVFSAGVLFNL